MKIQVQCPGKAKNINKRNAEDKNQESEAGRRTPIEYPVEKEDKANREESCENVGQEHGTIIVTGFRKEVLITLIAALLHFKWFLKTEGASLEHVTLVAVGAFNVKNAVRFRAFTKHAR